MRERERNKQTVNALLLYRRPKFSGVILLSALENYGERLLLRLNSQCTADELLVLCLCTSLLIIAAMWLSDAPTSCSCVAAVAGFAAPLGALSLLASWRRNKLVSQLPSVIDVLYYHIRRGRSTFTALQLVADRFPDPFGDELRQVCHRVNLGETIPEALSSVARKYDCYDVELLCCAFALHRETGSNLPLLLKRTRRILVERLSAQERIIASRIRRLTCALLAISLALAVITAVIGTSIDNTTSTFITSGGLILLAASILLVMCGVAALFKLAAATR